jgi:Arc/MetJ-type ribon-helix-helix transcriptional regulator
MPGAKAGRPFVYQSEDERPVTLSVRVPHALYAQVEARVTQRRTTRSEAILEAIRLWLETPADPRELLASDNGNTVMQEWKEMVKEEVERQLAQRPATQAPAPTVQAQAPAPTREDIPSDNGNTVIQGRGGMRQRILTLLYEHQEGLSAEQLRAHLNPEKPIGDTLQGMRRQGVVRFEGSGKERRYFVG